MSTPTMTRPPEHPAPTEPSRSSVPAWIAAILAMALIGALAWALYEPATDDGTSALAPEMDALIEDYLTAWENYDEDLMRSVTTQGMVINEYFYSTGHDLQFMDNARISTHIDDTVDGAITFGFSDDYTWTTERIGNAIVMGDGPWFVSQGENWIMHEDPIPGLEGDWTMRFEGVATYVLVSEDGELRIANHFWTGEEMMEDAG